MRIRAALGARDGVEVIRLQLQVVYVYVIHIHYQEEVVEMTNVILLLATLVFAFGVLIGSSLQTQAVHAEYRQIAERVRELRELQKVLVDQDRV